MRGKGVQKPENLADADVICEWPPHSNLLIGQRLCREDSHLNVVNAALSLVAPAAYNLSEEKDRWQYFEWTCITFAVNLSSTALLLNVLSYLGFLVIHQLPQSGTIHN